MLPLTEEEKNSTPLYAFVPLCNKDVVFGFLLDFLVEFMRRIREASGPEKAIIKSMASKVSWLGFRYWSKQFTSRMVFDRLLHLSVPLCSHLQNGKYTKVPTHKVVTKIY